MTCGDPPDAAGGPPEVILYTDGACLGNPGPGGWAAILVADTHRRELSGGVRRTTNNRMELQAVIQGLTALKRACRVRIVSDSQYVIRSFSLGWALRWRDKGWMRTRKDPVENADLWRIALDAVLPHEATFEWVRGHAGHPENERADVLATGAARGPNLPPDEAFESGSTTVTATPPAAPAAGGWLDL